VGPRASRVRSVGASPGGRRGGRGRGSHLRPSARTALRRGDLPAEADSRFTPSEAVAFVFPERPVVRWNRADGCRWRELLATWTFVCSAADWSLSTENRHQRGFQRQPLRSSSGRCSTMVLEVAVGQTIWANNRVPVCPEPSHRVPRLRPDTRIHQLKRNDTRLDGTARYHSEHSDNAEVASSILASPTVKSLFRPTNPRSAAHRLSWAFLAWSRERVISAPRRSNVTGRVGPH